MKNPNNKIYHIVETREDSTIHFRIACKVHESITYVTFVMKKAFKRKKHKQLQALQNAIIDKKKHSDFGGGSLTSTLGETIQGENIEINMSLPPLLSPEVRVQLENERNKISMFTL